jgi:hypothetical protein
MLYAHIALALELIAMAMGSLLVLKCCKLCCFEPATCTDKDAEKSKIKRRNCFGFFKFLGYFIVVVSLGGFICTSVTMVSDWMKTHETEVEEVIKPLEMEQREKVPEPERAPLP